MDKKILLGIAALVVFLALAGIFFVFVFFGTYNEFVVKDKIVQEKWSNVEVQYQRRIDLIPNIVSTVKGTANFEQETLTKLTELRSQWQTQPEKRLETANQIESALSKLLIITENYPELRATEQFQSLIVELEGTENRISFARQEFNAAVNSYNTVISTFPNSFVAGFYGLKEKSFFEAAAGAENAPKVDFT